MKKLFISLIAIVGIAVCAQAKDSYSHDAAVLPKAAQTTISQNFNSKVSVVKIDKDFGRISEYEVVLTDGTEITFDRNGNWDNIEVAGNKSVPSALVPQNDPGLCRQKPVGHAHSRHRQGAPRLRC